MRGTRAVLWKRYVGIFGDFREFQVSVMGSEGTLGGNAYVTPLNHLGNPPKLILNILKCFQNFVWKIQKKC